MGWAFMLAIFQMIHLFLPITAYTTMPILAFGVLVSIAYIRDLIRRFYSKQSSQTLCVVYAILTIVVVAWIASRAMLLPVFTIQVFIISMRFAGLIVTLLFRDSAIFMDGWLFNQSFFTYVASLNFYPFLGMADHWQTVFFYCSF
ncbi:MAG: hypothetical protein MZV65_00360 [Chromatiales bacterium]|nr:hypothetical protein [Chromatiales bacterium]